MNARDDVLAALARDGVALPARWRVIITDSESPTGVAPVCTGENSDALHMIDDYPGGLKRDEDGVYDCCPWPQFDTYSEATATYLVSLLNADSNSGGQHDAVRADVLHEVLGTIRESLRAGGRQQIGLLAARRKVLALLHGVTPEPPRRRVSHNKVAERCRQQPGVWLTVAEYVNGLTAYGMVRAIRKGESGGIIAYLPAGTFEARSERTENGTTVEARYVGPLADFFQVGHTYSREHHGDTVRFSVEHVSASPDGRLTVAHGWRTDSYSGWDPFDSDDLTGWTDVTESGDPNA